MSRLQSMPAKKFGLNSNQFWRKIVRNIIEIRLTLDENDSVELKLHDKSLQSEDSVTEMLARVKFSVVILI